MNPLQKARAQLLLRHPFFATLLMSLDTELSDRVPTMGTDMRKLYINPDFVEKLGSVDNIMFVLAHEVMHVALEHGLRLNSRNPALWNVACDFAINLILVDSGLTFPTDVGGCLDPAYKGMSADQIYEKLQKLADKARSNGGSGKPGEGGVPGLDEMHGGPDGQGDLLPPPGAQDAAGQAELKRQIQQKVATAANVARMAGKLSGDLERLVGEILDPKVAWADLLRDYMTRDCKDDESWGRRNRRFQNIYLPTRFSERMGPIVCVGDTSGSISNDELRQYAGETKAIIEDVRPESVRFLWADTRVAGEQFFEDGLFEPGMLKPAGGGGTDMRVPLTHAEQYEPEVTILFTDGYTPWPAAAPPYQLIVCCTTDAPTPDYALTVRI